MRKFSVLFVSVAMIFSGMVLAPANALITKYTITYAYNGANSGNSTLTSDYTLVTPPASPTPITLPKPGKAGFAFEGWYSDSGLTTAIGVGGDSYTPSATDTVYANWTACGDFATVLSSENSSITWSKNPVSATGAQTLTVTLKDGSVSPAGGDPVLGVAGCLTLDAGAPIQPVTFTETAAGLGVYEAQVTFDSLTSGFPVTVDGVDPVTVGFLGAPINAAFALNPGELRIDAGNLDVGSQAIQLTGVKNTVASLEITVTNIGAVSETLSSDPTITPSASAVSEDIISATGDGTNIIYTASNTVDFAPGQLVTITGFTESGFNLGLTQVVTTFGNTFTLEGATVGTESPGSATADSTSVFIDSSTATAPCASGTTLAPDASCSVIVYWGITTQAATIEESIGTLELVTEDATQNFDVRGTASEGRKVVTTISGTSASPTTVDPHTEWCATAGGMTVGGTTTCSSPVTWQPARVAFGVDPQSIYYRILSRIYPGDHPFGNITGTSHWLSCDQYTDSSCGLQKTNIYRIAFTLPTGWYDPAFTFTMQGDNFLDSWINPPLTESGAPALTPSGPEYFVPGGSIQEDVPPRTTCSANYTSFPNNKSTPPSSTDPGNMFVVPGTTCTPSTAHLVAGVNYVYVRLTDGGGLAGINYRLDLGYRETEPCTEGCGGDDPAPPPAPKEALIPRFGTPESLNPQGYTVQILNYVGNSAFTWKTKVSEGTAEISPTGLLTVSKDLPVTVSTSQTKYPNGSATQTAPIRPLSPVVFTPTVSPTTSYYSENVSGAYSAHVAIGVSSPANVDHVYTDGTFHYSVKADGGATVTKAVSNGDGTSVTYTVTGTNAENLILAGELPEDPGQFVTVVGLNDSNAALSVSNWQVISVSDLVPTGGAQSYEFVARAPQLDAAALDASQFTASVAPNKTVEKRTGGLAQTANCAFVEGSNSTTLANIHLTGSATMALLPVCTLSISHDADSTHASSSGETVFTFVKEQPTRTYTGTVSMLVNSKFANLNSSWNYVTACTTTGKYTYSFTGGSLTTPYVTQPTAVPLQSVLVPLPVGAYEVTPNYAGDHNCAATQADLNATSGFVVYDSSNSAYGEGAYNVNGKAYFEFESHKLKSGLQTGNLVWNWNNSWRFKGKLSAFGKKTSGVIGNGLTQQACSTTNPCGSLSGAGTLEYFNGSSWVSVGSAINVNVSLAAKKLTKTNAIPGHIGITFGYKALPGQPTLPTNALFPMIRRNSHDYGVISLK